MSDGNLTSPLSPKPTGERRRRRGREREKGNGKKEKGRKRGGGGQLLSRAFTGRRGAPFALTTYDATPAIIMALPPSLSEFILGFSSFCPTSLSLLVFLLQSGLLPLHTPLLSLYPAAVTACVLCSHCLARCSLRFAAAFVLCCVCSRHLTPNSILTGSELCDSVCPHRFLRGALFCPDRSAGPTGSVTSCQSCLIGPAI